VLLIFSTLFGRWLQRCGLSLSVPQQLVFYFTTPVVYSTVYRAAVICAFLLCVRVVSPTGQPDNDASALIAGIVVGVCVALLLVVIIVLIVIRKRK